MDEHERMGGNDDGGPWRPSWYAIVAAVVLALAALAPPLGGAEPRATAGGAAPASLLGQGWFWLGANKDPLSALAAMLTAVGVAVAVLTFVKAQRLNQAKAVYDAMKEARDLLLKSRPLKETDKHSDPVAVGISFYASVDQYRLSGLIDPRTWRNFEADLEHLVQRPDVAAWLDDPPGAHLSLPPIGNFDPRFVSHMREVKARVGGRAGARSS